MNRKPLLLLLLMALLLPSVMRAQNAQVVVGDGTATTSNIPICIYYNYSFSQMIYTAEQINENCNYVGAIESISFYYASSTEKTFPVTVFMKTTEKSAFESTTDWETLAESDIVYEGDMTVSTPGWVEIPLNTAFNYDGTSNLLIAINKGYYSNWASASWQYTGVLANQTLYARNDGSAYDPYAPSTGTMALQMANIMFGMTIDYPAPSGLTNANVSPTTTTISWTAPQSNSAVTGYTYQYKKSTDEEWSAEANVSGTTVTLNTLDASTTYNFRVMAKYGSNESCYAEIEFTTIDPCSAPTDLEITDITHNSANLSWTPGYDETSWVVNYKKSSDTEYMTIDVTGTPATSLTDLENYTYYNVVITPACDPLKTLTGNFRTLNINAAPTDLVVSNLSQTSATLSWTPGNPLQTQWTVAFRVGTTDEWTTMTVTGNPTASLTGLTSGTTYNVRVYVSEDYLLTGSFTTLFGIPLVEAFDATTIPSGWRNSNLLLDDVMNGTAWTASSGGWYYNTSNGVFDGSNHARVNIYGTSCRYWLVTPAVLMENNVQLSFDVAYTAYSGTMANPATSGTDDKFVILVTTDNCATWTILRQYDNAGSAYVLNDLTPAGSLVSIDLSSYAGQNVAVAFYAESTVSNADNNLHVDNVSIDYIPSCPKPLSLAVNYTGGTTAELSWESDATQWNLDVNGTLRTVSTNPYTLSNLELGTNYEVKVQAKCGSSETSDWSNTVSFTTDLCMPENMCELTFVLTDKWGDSWNGAAIQVVDVETNIVIAEMANENLNGTTGSGENEVNTKTLSVCDGSAINFVWKAGSYDGEASYVVYDINEEEIFSGSGAMTAPVAYTVSCAISNCKKPTNLAASNIGPRSADLSWTENGDATAWQICINGDEKNPVNVTSNPYTLTGLEPESPYTIKVRANCGDEQSNWSTEITFNTIEACPAPTSLSVSKLMPTSARVKWTGISGNYDLRYAVFSGAKNEPVKHSLKRQTLPENLRPFSVNPNARPQISAMTNRGDYRGWLSYDNDAEYYTGVGFGEDQTYDITWAVMYPASMLGGNPTLSKIAVYEDSEYNTADITIKVYSGGDEEPGTLIYTETVTPEAADAFHEITLASEVTIDPTQNLWISLTESGTWVVSSCQNTDDNNQWIYYDLQEDYAGWYQIDDLGLTGYGWMIRAYVTGFDPNNLDWIEVNGIAADSCDLSGLLPETMYLAQVRSNCDTDGYSSWAEITFTTPGLCDEIEGVQLNSVSSMSAILEWTGYQENYNIRYRTAETSEVSDGSFVDDFENGLDSWTVIRNGEGTTNTDWHIFDPTSFSSGGFPAYSGTYVAMARSWASSAYSVDNWLISPAVSLTGTLTYWVRDDGSYHEHYDIYVSTTGNSVDDFSLLYEPGNASGEWTKHTVDLSSYNGAQGYIAFRNVDEDQDYLLIDYVVIGVVNEVPAGDWELIEDTENNPFLLENLDPETTYEVQVQGNCSKTEQTEWSEVITFTTTAICGVAPELESVEVTATTAEIDWTAETDQSSWNIRYRLFNIPDAEGLTDPNNVLITLTAPDVWGDGSGYQMLIDADATAYGTIIPETGGLTTSGDASDAVYAEFEYKIPENADGSLTTTNIVVENSVTIEIPAGTYDWCITNPTPGDRVWIASGGRYDDFVFEAGKSYEFNIYLDSETGNDSWELNYDISDWTVIATEEKPYMITDLTPNSIYEVQVQGICGEGYESEWSESGFFQMEAPTDVEQVMTLSVGWGWFSSYIEYPADALTIMEEGIAAGSESGLIKSQTQAVTLNEGEWGGTLTELRNESMYLILSEGGEVTLSGPLSDPAAHPISISGGWNWIGYISANAMPVSEALASITPAENDQIKTQGAYSSYDSEDGWNGALSVLEPGKGYLYLHNGGGAELVYPSSSKGGVVVPELESYWKADHHAYPTNLTMMVTLEENQIAMRKGSHEIGAFVNGECRGSARLQEVNGRYIAFLTVSGEDGEEVVFRLYDVTTGTEYAKVAEERISYQSDAVYGTMKEPMRMHFNMTGVGENDGTVSLYPNPTSAKVLVQGNGIESVRVYNAMGQLLHAEEDLNAEQVELNFGQYSAGVYTVSVTMANGQTTNRMVVKE